MCDYVNLDGVFRPARGGDETGVLLDAKSPNWIKLKDKINNIINTKSPLEHSKYVLKGAWFCQKVRCHLFNDMVQGECVVIWDDLNNKNHFQTTHQCVSCEQECKLLPVAVFVEYLSQKGYDDLRIWLQRQTSRTKQTNRGVAKVHVLANNGAQQSLPPSPHTGRILGPNGEFFNWLHTRDEASKESSD